MINLVPRPPFPQERPNDWAPELDWTFLRKEKSREPAGIRTPDRAARSPYNIPNTLPYLPTNHSDVTNEQITLNYVLYHTFIPSGRAVQGVGLRPLACWDCGFESLRRHGCLSVLSVVRCQVEVSATG